MPRCPLEIMFTLIKTAQSVHSRLEITCRSAKTASLGIEPPFMTMPRFLTTQFYRLMLLYLLTLFMAEDQRSLLLNFQRRSVKYTRNSQLTITICFRSTKAQVKQTKLVQLLHPGHQQEILKYHRLLLPNQNKLRQLLAYLDHLKFNSMML